MSFSRISLAGTLLQAPERRFTQNNQVVCTLQLSVPTPPRRTGEASPALVVKVLCWRNLADAVANLQQGSVVHIEGRLQLNTLTTPEGVQKKMFEVDAQNVYQLPGLPVLLRAEGGDVSQPQVAYSQQGTPAPNASVAPANQAQPVAVAAAPQANFGDLSADDFLTEDDIPF